MEERREQMDALRRSARPYLGPPTVPYDKKSCRETRLVAARMGKRDMGVVTTDLRLHRQGCAI